ncbi:MAG: hypothetical protein MIO93_09860 [ANME-2 cluster archaeon]|nr:hypothetical protein [ANME-2 cluster archaeon]
MDKKIFLIIALLAVGIYSAPGILSLFVGQHYFHDDVECIKCHVAEYNDIMISPALAAHKRAANNTNYTTYMSLGGIFYNASALESLNGIYGTNAVIYSMDLLNATIGNNVTYDEGEISYFWNDSNGNGTWDEIAWNGSTWLSTDESFLVDLDQDNNSQINGYEICFLCHKPELIGMTTLHSSTVILCDDDRCHGNLNNVYNDYKILNVSRGVIEAGKTISEDNVHSYFYLHASNESSSYRTGLRFNHSVGNAIPSGDFISKGHWTCEACHSETNKSVVLIPQTSYDHSDFNAVKSRY